MNYQELEDAYTSGYLAKRGVTFVRGEGCKLWDDQGVEYLDLLAGPAVAGCGHAHPHIANAIAAQAHTLINCLEVFYNDKRAEFLQKLNAVTPPDIKRFFLCNSGTEAIECCLKTARQSTGRTDFVACHNAFHGRSMGSLSATHKALYRESFEPLVPGFCHVPFNDSAQLAAAVNERTAGILIEPVQGEGGVQPAEKQFLETARRLCDEHGCLLIFDEIQTGYGRTGKWWGHQHFGVEPDLMAMAKGMGNGFPVAACGMGSRIGELIKGSHASTYGGNPLACAVGLAVFEIFEQEGLVERAAENGAYFLEQLRAIEAPLIRAVRGLGLMLAVELKCKALPYIKRLQNEHHIITTLAGPQVVRFVPPLVITRDEIDRAVAALTTLLTETPAEATTEAIVE
jgi:acetylornithine/LysW-gamma-L-lysine aminotransferase